MFNVFDWFGGRDLFHRVEDSVWEKTFRSVIKRAPKFDQILYWSPGEPVGEIKLVAPVYIYVGSMGGWRPDYRVQTYNFI